jgi:hypothetical protein
VIIVGVGPLLRHFQTNFKDLLFTRCLLEKCTKFLAELKQQGVKLVFPIAIDNDIVKRSRNRSDEYQEGVEFIDQIEKDNNLESLCEFYNKKPHNDFRAIRDPAVREQFLEAASQYGEFEPFCVPEHHTTVFYRKLAKDLNAFAILAFDSNYIIAEGSWKYWASNDLDFESFTVEEYNKQAVLNHLGLHFQQIPLFQALSGVLMSAEDLEALRKIFCPFMKLFFQNVARFIRTRFYPPTSMDAEEIKRLIHIIYGQPLSKNFVVDLKKAVKYITIPVSSNFSKKCI